MKKLILAIVIISLPILLNAQLSGSGTYADPYSGIFQGNLQWNISNFSGGKIYINDDVTIDNELLTIEAGMSVVFLSEGADLIITETGQLNAAGTSVSKITFTADDNNNGIYGELNERWGHISFQNMTTTNPNLYPSIIDNCIVEYGQKNSTPSEIDSYGGGIHAGFTYLTIRNSSIRNNFAGWGGGIFVNSNFSPNILSCNISNNSAANAGGGIYFWTNTNSHITNSIIAYNSCGPTGGGGILLGDNAGNIRVINCTIVNNTSSDPNRGQNIQFHYTVPTLIRVINSIIWGSDNSIYHAYYYPVANDFINCALQDVSSPASTYTNCIDLNSSNSNVSGPNFITTNGSDWSIKVISPCLDKGIESYSGVTIPSTDFIGNPTVYHKDIGAYEVQYNRWKTTASTTDWATSSNWEGGVPSSSSDVIIPIGAANYPTGSTTQNFTVGTGKYLIIEQGARATLSTLTNNGTLKLNSSASSNASLILNTYSKGGGSTEEIQLFLTGGGTKTPLTYKWHYISSPVTSLPVSTFAPTYTLNVAQWVQDRPSTSLTQGWVAYDGYIYSTGGMGGPTFSTLTPGKGYDFFDGTDNTFTFSGQLNTGDINAVLDYKSGNDDLWGYNLIGNPFSSGLDWDYIITHSFPANTTKSLYFTRNSVLCSYIAGVGVPGDVNGIIPPMQGFFSKTYSTGNTIVLAAAARTHNNIHATYKGSKSLIPLVRLALADSLLTDETVVRFDDLAKSYLDNDFDAVKMFLDPSLSSIHTSLGGTDYAINGLPFPETLLEIPVTLNIATDEETKSITASELQNLDNYNVTLTDVSTGFVANLRTAPTVTFAAEKGTVSGRFILKISAVTTGVETQVTTNNKFNIYPANNNINIQTVADEWEGKFGTVRIMDLTGKTISDLKNTEFRKNSLTQVASPNAKGIYVVEIKAGNMRYVGKVVIR